MHGEFLRLLQMTEAGRKAEGRGSIEISDADVTKAQGLDEHMSAHLEAVGGAGHEALECAECAKVSGGVVELREGLHSRGVDFPVEVFASR